MLDQRFLIDYRLEIYDADLNILRAEACQVIAKKMLVVWLPCIYSKVKLLTIILALNPPKTKIIFFKTCFWLGSASERTGPLVHQQTVSNVNITTLYNGPKLTVISH